MDFNEISAISTTVQTILTLGREAISLTKNIEVKEKIINLFGLVMELQKLLADTIDAKQRLSEELNKLKNWAQTESEYMLKEFVPGFFVYQKKQLASRADPVQSLCANCFHQQQISILQCLTPHTTGYKKYHCPRCKLEVDADV